MSGKLLAELVISIQFFLVLTSLFLPIEDFHAFFELSVPNQYVLVQRYNKFRYFRFNNAALPSSINSSVYFVSQIVVQRIYLYLFEIYNVSLWTCEASL
jgi:hypothetical protein